MVRDRSFGGKAGTWLRKKRRKLSIGAGSKANEAQSAASTTPTIHTSTTTTSSTGAGSKATSAVITTSTTINTTSVIGWDEVRARPIYGKPTRPTSSSNSRSSSENDSSSDIVTTASPVVRRALRSYGGKRRNRISTDPDDFDTVEAIHSSSNCDASSPGSLPETMLNSLMASPRRVSMAGNAQRLMSSSSSSSSGKGNHSSVFEFQEKDLPKQRNIKNKFVLMEDDCCKTPKGRVSVVSSTTSLSAAKHFFQALDREHNLVVTAESNSPSPNHGGRQVTRQRIAQSSSRNDLPLTQGYTSYFTACQASNCSPLPLVRVATEIYDGFLDD